jgi:hypothetical protein
MSVFCAFCGVECGNDFVETVAKRYCSAVCLDDQRREDAEGDDIFELQNEDFSDDSYDDPDVDFMQEQNDFAHDDYPFTEDQHLDGMYEE